MPREDIQEEIYSTSKLNTGFSITRNGLLGGVIFGNVESVPNSISDNIQSVIPAGGLGLRIKINKFSGTNLAIDYGILGSGVRTVFSSIWVRFSDFWCTSV